MIAGTDDSIAVISEKITSVFLQDFHAYKKIGKIANAFKNLGKLLGVCTMVVSND